MSTMHTTAGEEYDHNTRSSAAQWSDLADDLLGRIRLRIASQRDRARFAAVCRPWRAALLRIPAPPAVPLLLLLPRAQAGQTKHVCGGGPGDEWVLRLPVKGADMWYIGSHDDGWVAAYNFYQRRVLVVNLFSGVQVGECSPCLSETWFSDPCHVVFSDVPTSSSGCILAAITESGHTIALWKVGCQKGWTKQGWKNRKFTGVVFCNGDLYGLTYQGEELVRFKIGMDKDGLPVLKFDSQLAVRRHHLPSIVYESHIVELHGTLLKAIRTQWFPNHEPFFKVFKLVDAEVGEAYQHEWVEMASFGDYALFLGPTRAKAVHVPVGAECHGLERNHIYYSIANCSTEMSDLRGYEVHALRSEHGRGMYRIEDQSIGDGIERTGYCMMGYQNAAMWLHPPDL
ncbi:unnamed protein product [Alopecurus aequalis]